MLPDGALITVGGRVAGMVGIEVGRVPSMGEAVAGPVVLMTPEGGRVAMTVGTVMDVEVGTELGEELPEGDALGAALPEGDALGVALPEGGLVRVSFPEDPST